MLAHVMRRFLTVGLLSDPEARLILMGLAVNGLGVVTIVVAYLNGRWGRSAPAPTPELVAAGVFELVGGAIVFFVLGKLLVLGALKRR